MTLPWKHEEDLTFFTGWFFFVCTSRTGQVVRYSLPTGRSRAALRAPAHGNVYKKTSLMPSWTALKVACKKWCFCGKLQLVWRVIWPYSPGITGTQKVHYEGILHFWPSHITCVFQVFQYTFVYWEACHKCHVLQGKNDRKSWFLAECHMSFGSPFFEQDCLKFFFWASIPPINTLSPKNSLLDEQLFI